MFYTCKPANFTVYDNRAARKTMEAVRKELGCDVICNGYLFDMSTGKPVCNIKLNGTVLSGDQYTYIGYGWNDGEMPVLQAGAGDKENFISCVALVMDGQPLTMYYDSGLGGRRGRTAIGFKADGAFVLWCSTDRDEPKTMEELRQLMLDAGCASAIALDGGGSSGCITPERTIPTARLVTSYVCVWEEPFVPYLVRITASVLNVRKGAGTEYGVAMTVKRNEVYTIVGERDGWGKLKSGAGWIKLSYTRRC